MMATVYLPTEDPTHQFVYPTLHNAANSSIIDLLARVGVLSAVCLLKLLFGDHHFVVVVFCADTSFLLVGVHDLGTYQSNFLTPERRHTKMPSNDVID